MSEHMKRHHTRADHSSEVISFLHKGIFYAIPEKIAKKYQITQSDAGSCDALDAFQGLIDEHTAPGLALKGVRAKEGFTQVQLAKKLKITQANLSAMENGRRPVGKVMAKRIAKLFGLDYRLFL
jgi:DNA-binding XRE family transcriptional regulator